MVVKIRLARFGRRHAPFYNIVVAHARTARNSKPLEVLGTYEPQPKKNTADTASRRFKDIKLDMDRARYWLGVGAQPSEPMWRMLSMAGIIESKYDKRRASAVAAASDRRVDERVPEKKGESEAAS